MEKCFVKGLIRKKVFLQFFFFIAFLKIMSSNLLGASPVLLAEASAAVESKNQDVFRSRVSTSTASSTTAEEVRKTKYPWKIVWINIIGLIYLHIAGVYGLYLTFFTCAWSTFFWCLFLTLAGGLGHTAGSHRLWAHKTYKAKLPLRILLAFFQTLCFENHIYEWVRDHRVHHKFTDTDADPHNSRRGFFFSHVGWLLIRKHKDVKDKGKTVDLSDLEADSVVVYQRKFYPVIMPLCSFILPTLIPWYYWGEKLTVAWYTASMARYALCLNVTWLVNSAAHLYGTKPYDRTIHARENSFVGHLALGEGWHNYHHVFPWDYKAAELGYSRANITAGFIDLCAKIGWAYDLKTVSEDLIRKRIARTGDGTKKVSYSATDLDEDARQNFLWGWGDRDMKQEDIRAVRIFNNLSE